MRRTRGSKSAATVLAVVAVALALAWVIPGVGANQSTGTTRVLYSNPRTVDGSGDPLLTAIRVDGDLNLSTDGGWLGGGTGGDDLLAKFDVVVLVDPVLEGEALDALLGFVAGGGGLVVVCGPDQAANPEVLVGLGLVRQAAAHLLSNSSEGAITRPNSTSENPYTSIDWNSCPEVSNYTALPLGESKLGDGVVVDISKRPRDDSASLSPDPLLLHLEHGQGRIVLSAGWLAEPALHKQHLWPYFNYLVYSMLKFSAHGIAVSYADWEYSPVPHRAEQVGWTLMVAGLVLFSAWLFTRQRKRSRVALDLESIAAIAESPEEEGERDQSLAVAGEKATGGGDLGAPREPSIAGEEPRLLSEEEIDEWEEIGYHRQLSGFLFALFTALFLIGPQLLLTLWLYPVYILPFPQAAGYYSFVLRFFEAFWLFLDFGTSTAAAKFFAQYRVKQPDKAVRYIQIYIWWQFLSGIGQFAVVSVIGLFVFPHTQYAHMSWFFILHSMIQFPGVLAVILYFFQGVQKLDTAQLLEVLKTAVFSFLFQYVMVILFRAVFRQLPQFGEVFGAVVGLALGGWVSEFAFFGVSFKMFKARGYSGKTLFRIDFSGEELKETFKFGAKLVAGNVWVPLVWFLQVILLSMYVTDYSSEMAYFEMAYTIAQVMALVGLYLNGMMPPISEALGNGKEKLVDLGVVEMLSKMNWLSWTIGAIMLVCGDKIIVGFSGPTWARATVYFSGLWLHALMGPYSWAGDRIFQGTGRTDLNLYTWIMEQGIRAVGLLILVPRIGMMGVIYSYNLALFLKGVTVWILIRKKIWHGPVYPWKMFAAPAISALSLYFILQAVASVVWQGDLFSTIILVVVAVFGGFFLGTFFNGLLGLWDDDSLAEFDKASKMVKGVGFMARSLYKVAETGARASPLRNFNRVEIYAEAMEEARALTAEKRVLEV
ncbi:MAG: oligosaccharide flippase family protein [Promethearchaeota archaeon]